MIKRRKKFWISNISHKFLKNTLEIKEKIWKFCLIVIFIILKLSKTPKIEISCWFQHSRALSEIYLVNLHFWYITLRKKPFQYNTLYLIQILNSVWQKVVLLFSKKLLHQTKWLSEHPVSKITEFFLKPIFSENEWNHKCQFVTVLPQQLLILDKTRSPVKWS